MERLHERGYISDPQSKAKSVVMTEEGGGGRANCSLSTSAGRFRADIILTARQLKRGHSDGKIEMEIERDPGVWQTVFEIVRAIPVLFVILE